MFGQLILNQFHHSVDTIDLSSQKNKRGRVLYFLLAIDPQKLSSLRRSKLHKSYIFISSINGWEAELCIHVTEVFIFHEREWLFYVFLLFPDFISSHSLLYLFYI